METAIWLVPLAVLVAGLWRAWAGPVVLAGAFALFGSPPGGPYLAALDVACLLLLLTAWRKPGRPPLHTLDHLVLVFALVSVASLVPPAWMPPSWHPRVLIGLLRQLPGVETWSLLYSWRAALNLLLGCGLYFAVRRAYRDRSPRPLGLGLAAGLVLLLGLGLAERAGLLDLGGYRAIETRYYADRLHALFFHSGWLAEYIVVATPTAVSALWLTGRRWRIPALGLAGLALLSLPLTAQRGAWLAAAVQLLALAVVLGPLLARNPRVLRRCLAGGAGALLLVVTVGLALPGVSRPVLERLGTTHSSGRTRLWAQSLQLMAERPLLGWGLGTFNPVYDQSFPPKLRGAVPTRATPHNLYLSVGMERGVPGLAALGLLAIGALARLRRVRAADQAEARGLAVGLGLSLLGLAVYGMFQYMLFLKLMEWLFWLLLAAVACLPGPAPRRRMVERAAAVLALLVLAMVPLRLYRSDPAPGRGNFSFGFHEPERRKARDYRWTTGWAVERVTRESNVLELQMANGHPRAADHPLDVSVRFDGQEVGRFRLNGGWETRRMELAASERGWGVLELEAQPTFRPFLENRRFAGVRSSSDIRQLGVAVGYPRWVEPDSSP
jgi:O-antigen ligase